MADLGKLIDTALLKLFGEKTISPLAKSVSSLAESLSSVLEKIGSVNMTKGDLQTQIDNIPDPYTHPTSSGNKHIPSGGSSGKILRWASDGTATWGEDKDTTYSNFVKSGNGAKAGLVPAPSTTAGTSKYLREDGTWQTPPDTNTWRGIQNNLTSTSTSDSLAAAQGKVLKGLIDEVKSLRATLNAYGLVKVTDSSAVTDSAGLALAATEKNASIDGTLANQISQLNTDLTQYIKASWKIDVTTDSDGNIYIGEYPYVISVGLSSVFHDIYVDRVFHNLYDMWYATILKLDGTPYTGNISLIVLYSSI